MSTTCLSPRSTPSATSSSQTREELKVKVAHFFGGLTNFRQRNEGLWKVGNLQVRDELIIWRVLSVRGAEGDAFIQSMKREIERRLKQNEILIVRRQVYTI